MHSSRAPRNRHQGRTTTAAFHTILVLLLFLGADRGLANGGLTGATEPNPEDSKSYLPLVLRSGTYNPAAPTARATQVGPPPSPTSLATSTLPAATSDPPSPTLAPPTSTATALLPRDNECADMHPDWVFCDAFEEGTTWDGSVAEPPLLQHPGPFQEAQNHVAQLRVPAGPGGNGLWKRLPLSDRLYARWYVYWELGHDLTARHHGPGGLGADTAWYTGRSGIRPDGDEYFVSTLEASTRSPHYVYSYTYYRGMYMDCADPNGRCWGDHFPCYAGPRYCTRPEYLPRVQQSGTQTGRWYCFEQMIDAGTAVTDGANADGQLDFWIDGLQIGPWSDLWWRTVPTLKINFLWLFLYHHDDEHSTEGLLLDNVVVSTNRVGCRRLR